MAKRKRNWKRSARGKWAKFKRRARPKDALQSLVNDPLLLGALAFILGAWLTAPARERTTSNLPPQLRS